MDHADPPAIAQQKVIFNHFSGAPFGINPSIKEGSVVQCSRHQFSAFMRPEPLFMARIGNLAPVMTHEKYKVTTITITANT